MIADAYSSQVRPVLAGQAGAVSAAHPLAVAAGQQMLQSGGNAADALIAAQALLCVLMPDACGLGGDMLALVHVPGGRVEAINGTGKSPMAMTHASEDGPHSITVPGIVHAWQILNRSHGRLPLNRLLAPAIALARTGLVVTPMLQAVLKVQRERLARGGAQRWALFDSVAGQRIVQPELAALLEDIGADGADAFYRGGAAAAIVGAVRALGGVLSEDDLAAHETVVAPPVSTPWGSGHLHTQPPMSQGILLNMAASGFAALADVPADLIDHVAVELTEAAFESRSDVAEGVALLERSLAVNLERASLRGGPRAYLHTAGVAAADADGMVISSLVSVFDDFGSAVFVPELGITLNNRAGGFTTGANTAAPGKRPVHTLAPAMITGEGGATGLATPGADGQVQTLLQILLATGVEGMDLARAIARPRWRSENGELLVERGHSAASVLERLGHRVRLLPEGEVRFGAVVCAGHQDQRPFAVADWRRECLAGVA